MATDNKSSRGSYPQAPISISNEELANASLDALSSNIAVIDTSGKIIMVNEAWRSFALNNGGSGHTLEIGSDYLDVLKRAMESGDPDATKAYQGIVAILAGDIRLFVHEYPCHSPYQERWFLMQATPLAKQGKIYGVVVNHLDITDRHTAERSLQRTEKRFTEIASTIDETIWIRNKEKFIYVNDSFARVWGRSPTALYKDPGEFFAAIHPEDRERIFCEHKKCLDSGQGFKGTYRIIRPDGEVRWIEEREFPVYEDNAAAVRFVGSARDITEQKNLQLKLEEANRVKTDFLNAVSHDLRTPLNAILGFTELLQDSSGLDETQRHYISLSRRAGFRLHGLIDTLLELSRLESGNVQLREELFNLRSFIQEQLELLTLHAEEKGLELVVRIDDDLPEYVYGDDVRFAQVLYNLVINAIKFTDQGSISVHAGVDSNDLVTVAVTDSGPGISAQEQTRIFEPFTQLDQSGSRTLGTGLGLTISRELCRLMGGDLWLESTLGRGSTFYFSADLRATADTPQGDQEQRYGHEAPVSAAKHTPCNREESSPSEQLPGTSSQHTPPSRDGQPANATPEDGYAKEGFHQGVSVLVAEDEPTNALLVQTILEQLGATVILVTDGQQALQKWRQESFDLLLLDVQMPYLDGLQTLEQIRHQEKERNLDRTCIAMLTAHAGEHMRIECEQLGADTFLTKPVQRQDLLAVLRWAGEQRLIDPQS
ncbi:two-component sensor histidine kinase [Halorhodospira halochloris]|uniref:histidine kinase n=1 Tax=Halorhodospira halochloris TaxID=1052 RepID=A0A0X8X9D2_HALHR|nr:ATP-binding protein [Halorhodospira halochloris]MBK1652535.1 hypothetical protein [Halorhodospira halochloris]BAU57860.1 two-component sensor histidine kinase [Halorhodospira halochloris]